MSLFKREQSLSEIEEETERAEAEGRKFEAEDRKAGSQLSIAQRRAATVELGKRGLSPRHFSFNFKKIIQFLKTH